MSAPELRPRHCTTEGCPCDQYRWDGRPDWVKCTCGHHVARHSFLPRMAEADR